MTKSEYVRLASPEKVYGQRHLLQSQLELLDLIQRFRNYKKLRNEELVLKVTLKSKIGETLNLITKLERLLPKAHYKTPTPAEVKRKERKIEKKLSLQEEIEQVRAKLARLGRDGL